ncbi:MAG: succinyl-diaminopimelate desuccinylase [Rickettsiaceae bacterium]|nr:succinyl-diaminopimelate desuccinylase [Rickettsiaceae bacterium]
MNHEILQLLSRLISFQSETPKGRDVLEFIEKYLNNLGFECIIKDFGPNLEVSNLYATYGNHSPNICFAGHVDVVPPGEKNLWQFDPYLMTIQNNKVYGRGIVDMKGAIACALSAAKHFTTREFNGSISFLLTTDEEGDGKYGLQEMLQYISNDYPPIDFCILGEPTSENKVGDMIKIGRRGSINFDVLIRGKQGHVAYPNLVINPTRELASILKNLYELKLDAGNKYFAASNLEITSVNTSSDISNVVPESCQIKFNIRFNNLHTPDSLVILIKQIVQDHCKASTSLSYTCSSLPFIQEISQEMQECKKLIQDICNVESEFSTTGGTSDARFIHQYCPVIELGLKSDMAHKIDENCKISDLQKLYDVYIVLLAKFLKAN